MAIGTPLCSIAELIRAKDWSSSSLGHPSAWPKALQHSVEFILKSRFPIFLVWGKELGFLYNESYLHLLGDKHPASLGQPFQEVWQEVWPDVNPLVERAFAGESLFFEDQPFDIRRNGTTQRIWVTFSYAPLHDETGEVAGFYCIVNDSTSRVQAEKRLAFQLELADKLSALAAPHEITHAACRLLGEFLNVGRAGYAEIDIEQGIADSFRDWTNSVLPSLAGKTAALEDFGPDTIAELKAGRTLSFDDIDLDGRFSPFAAAYANLEVRSAIVVPLLENGKLIAALYLHEAQPRNWTEEEKAIAEDTARRIRDAVMRARTEESLRDETRILEILNQTGQKLASTLDIHTLLQFITDAATEISGAKFGSFFYNHTDSQGDSFLLYTLSGAPREAFEKFGHPRATALFGPTFQGHAPIRSDDILKDERYGKMAPHHGMPKGHLPVRSYLAAPVKSRSGEVIGGLFFGHSAPGVFTERTERLITGCAAQAGLAIDNARLYDQAQQASSERERLLNSERAARNEAERLNRMKDEFLAMLAHELRNPLAPITTAAEMLKLASFDKERIRKTSDIITRQVAHMTELVDDLLDVSRVTRGLVTLQEETLNLESIAADAVEQVRALIDAKHQHLTMQVADEPMFLTGDRTRLTQIIANILNNAAKYTQPHGHISLQLKAHTDRLEISIEDNGIGIAPELLPHVFDLFTQGERSADRSQGGLGLGLALVKSLTALQGGKVAAFSAGKGQGSRFTLSFPRAAKTSNTHDDGSHSAQAMKSNSRKVLVIDDNVDAAMTLSMMLEALGHDVTVGHSAEFALESLKKNDPEILFLDIGLPEMDGYSLARRLRAMPETGNAVLVAVTGYGQPEDKERSAKAGFNHHLVKPVKLDQLLDLIK